MKLVIREEEMKDYKRTELVVKEAFLSAEMSDGNEHELVARLRKGESFIPELSMVAVIDEEIVGHVLLTRNKVVQEEMSFESLTLAPVSVLPAFKNKGIGSRLVERVLVEAQKQGFKSVIVLGHPEYYPRFGFKPASNWGIFPPFPVPDEAFMALELIEGGLANIKGTVQYPVEFE